MLVALNFISSLPPLAKFPSSQTVCRLQKRSTLLTFHPLYYFKTLNILSTLDYKIHIQWVKAHANTYGNEIADSLAKTGSLSGLITFSKIYLSYFHQFFNYEGINHFVLLYHNFLIEKGY